MTPSGYFLTFKAMGELRVEKIKDMKMGLIRLRDSQNGQF